MTSSVRQSGAKRLDMAVYLGTDASNVVAGDYSYMRGLDEPDLLASTSPSFSRIEGNRGNDFLGFYESAFGNLDGGEAATISAAAAPPEGTASTVGTTTGCAASTARTFSRAAVATTRFTGWPASTSFTAARVKRSSSAASSASLTPSARSPPIRRDCTAVREATRWTAAREATTSMEAAAPTRWTAARETIAFASTTPATSSWKRRAAAATSIEASASYALWFGSDVGRPGRLAEVGASLSRARRPARP